MADVMDQKSVKLGTSSALCAWQAWQWQGLRFSVHWPLQASNDKGNNHSCVVKVDDGTNSILLTGDIEVPAEQKMLSRYWQQVQTTLLPGTSPWQ